jgi:hypothetical protein
MPLTVRSSVPTPSPTPTSRVLRSSSRRISTDHLKETNESSMFYAGLT